MEKLRQPNEIILKNGKTLEEVLRLHEKWLKDEERGERADLSGEDLNKAILKGTNLTHANLEGADLEGAILKGTILSDAILNNVDLSHANLTHANLEGADLEGAILENCKFYLTNLYKCKGEFVGVENIGSRNDTTHYFYNDDRVICGCFDGTMEEFENKVKDSYDEDDKEYKQYIIAIRTLKELAELELKK